jgi:hypothetical protein
MKEKAVYISPACEIVTIGLKSSLAVVSPTPFNAFGSDSNEKYTWFEDFEDFPTFGL